MTNIKATASIDSAPLIPFSFKQHEFDIGPSTGNVYVDSDQVKLLYILLFVDEGQQLA